MHQRDRAYRRWRLEQSKKDSIKMWVSKCKKESDFRALRPDYRYPVNYRPRIDYTEIAYWLRCDCEAIHYYQYWKGVGRCVDCWSGSYCEWCAGSRSHKYRRRLESLDVEREFYLSGEWHLTISEMCGTI